MIYINKAFPDTQSIVIQVEGTLDDEALPILKDVCRQSLETGKSISLNLKGARSIDRKAKAFLIDTRDRIQLTDLPRYLQMEIGE